MKKFYVHDEPEVIFTMTESDQENFINISWENEDGGTDSTRYFKPIVEKMFKERSWIEVE